MKYIATLAEVRTSRFLVEANKGIDETNEHFSNRIGNLAKMSWEDGGENSFDGCEDVSDLTVLNIKDESKFTEYEHSKAEVYNE